MLHWGYGANGRGETYAGLVEVDGGYCYVRNKGEVATGRYEIVKTNGLKSSGYMALMLMVRWYLTR